MTDTPEGTRRRLPLLALAAIVVAFIVLNVATSPDVRTPVVCDRDLVPDADTVVMLSASWCGYCRRARVFMQDQGIRHCEYDVETSLEGRRQFAEMSLKVIPVIRVRDDTLVGFSKTELMHTLAAHDLATLGDYDF